MTESEWLACTDPTPMLEFLRGKGSGRKSRLFSIACVRRVWDSPKERQRRMLEVAEEYADGLVPREAIQEVPLDEDEQRREEEDRARWGFKYWEGPDPDETVVRVLAADPPEPEEASRAMRTQEQYRHNVSHRAWADIAANAQCQLLRDIFGSLLFRPVTVDPCWLTRNEGAVRRVARGIYDERDFDRLPILADALEDAGCANADMLIHCRGGGEHVRGCWVIDLLLGKE
jgi:hypothetical protein